MEPQLQNAINKSSEKKGPISAAMADHRPTSSEHQKMTPPPLSAVEELLRANQEIKELKGLVASLIAQPLDEEQQLAIHKQIQSAPIESLIKIAQTEFQPADLKKAGVIIQALTARVGIYDQQTTASADLMKELSETRSRMNTLERVVIITETQRDTLSEALRIIASQGKVDPVREGQEAARVGGGAQ